MHVRTNIPSQLLSLLHFLTNEFVLCILDDKNTEKKQSVKNLILLLPFCFSLEKKTQEKTQTKSTPENVYTSRTRKNITPPNFKKPLQISFSPMSTTPTASLGSTAVTRNQTIKKINKWGFQVGGAAGRGGGWTGGGEG